MQSGISNQEYCSDNIQGADDKLIVNGCGKSKSTSYQFCIAYIPGHVVYISLLPSWVKNIHSVCLNCWRSYFDLYFMFTLFTADLCFDKISEFNGIFNIVFSCFFCMYVYPLPFGICYNAHNTKSTGFSGGVPIIKMCKQQNNVLN